MFKYFLVVITLSTLSCALSLYGTKDDIVNLTDSNFKIMVENDKYGFWLIEFYSPICEECKKFASEYEEVAKALHGMINVGAVNADEYRYLKTMFGISAYPTIIVIKKDNDMLFTTYKGENIAKPIIEFVKSIIGDDADSEDSPEY